MSKFGETLKTEVAVLGQVLAGRAFADTLIPSKRNSVQAVLTRANGSVEDLSVGYNSRVDAGASWQAQLMGSAAGTPAAYLALTATVITPAKTDTTLTSEITTNGCARALATYGGYTAPSSLNGAASFTLSKTFTATGSQTVSSAALFNAASAGSLFVEAVLGTAATLANGDSLQITWTINI
jgi:hypothetical protein